MWTSATSFSSSRTSTARDGTLGFYPSSLTLGLRSVAGEEAVVVTPDPLYAKALTSRDGRLAAKVQPLYRGVLSAEQAAKLNAWSDALVLTTRVGRTGELRERGTATLSDLRYQPLGVSGTNCVTFLQQHFGLAIECPAGLPRLCKSMLAEARAARGRVVASYSKRVIEVGALRGAAGQAGDRLEVRADLVKLELGRVLQLGLASLSSSPPIASTSATAFILCLTTPAIAEDAASAPRKSVVIRSGPPSPRPVPPSASVRADLVKEGSSSNNACRRCRFGERLSASSSRHVSSSSPPIASTIRARHCSRFGRRTRDFSFFMATKRKAHAEAIRVEPWLVILRSQEFCRCDEIGASKGGPPETTATLCVDEQAARGAGTGARDDVLKDQPARSDALATPDGGWSFRMGDCRAGAIACVQRTSLNATTASSTSSTST